MADIQAIKMAIEQLVDDSKANAAKIEKGKAISTSLRDEIQIISLELNRDTPTLNNSSKANIDLSRSIVREGDCEVLKSSMEAISLHVKDNEATKALALMEPLAQNVTLLRKRLQYIAELEYLLSEYEQEKLLRAKLKALAEVLELPILSGVDMQPEQIDEQEQVNTIELFSDNFSTEEAVFNTTIH